MWILPVIFAAFFAAVLLVGLVVAGPGSKEVKQAETRLAALTAPQSAEAREATVTVRKRESFSTLPWLDAWLTRMDLSNRLRLLLYQAESPWTVGRVVLSATLLGGVSGYAVYYRTDALLLGLIVAGIGGAAPFHYVVRKRNKRFEQMRQFLPEALDLMVAAIRAGHSLSSAMGMAAKECPEPVKREFRQCFEEQNYGLEFRTALANLQYRMPIGEVRMLVTAILIQSESGGNLTEILEKAAHLIRESFRLRRQVQVHTAQGRISGWVLAMLPVVLGFLLYLINPGQMALLWTHPTGRKLVYTGIALTALGGLAIRRIVQIRY